MTEVDSNVTGIPRVRRTLCAAIVLALLIAWTGGAQAVMVKIDDFTQPDPSQFFLLGKGTNPSLQLTQMASEALGGQRDMLINVVGVATPTSIVGIVGFDTSYRLDALQVGTNGLSPSYLTLQYSGTNALNTATSLGNAHALAAGAGVDLTGGGTNDRFWLHFFSVDAQPTAGLDVTVTITSPGGKLSSVVAVAPNLLSPYDFFIPFSNLVGDALLTEVDSIRFAFNAVNKTPNVDFELQLVAAVPEPAGGILLGIGCAVAALAAKIRRRRSVCRC